MLNCPKTCKRSCQIDAPVHPKIVFTPTSLQPIEHLPATPNEESPFQIKPIHEPSTECPSTQICKSNHTNSYDDNRGKISFKGSYEGRHIKLLP